MVKEHRYIKATIEGKTLLGYIYPKYVNMSIDGVIHVARGIVYDRRKQIIVKNVEGLEFEYIT